MALAIHGLEIQVITVEQLAYECGFEMSFLAGRSGGERPLVWAHVVDISDPWNWIGPGELILTTGAGIPEPDAQKQWMEKVIASGANGLVVAAQPEAQELGEQALAYADTRAFPILKTSFSARFTELSKAVNNASLQADTQRLAAAQRAFNTYSLAIMRDESVEQRLNGVARAVDLQYAVLDEAGAVISSSSEAPVISPTPIKLERWVEPLRLELHVIDDDDLVGGALTHTFATIVGMEMRGRMASVNSRCTDAEKFLQAAQVTGADESAILDSFAHTLLGSRDNIAVVCLSNSVEAENFHRIRLSPHLWDRPVVTATYGDHRLIWLRAQDSVLAAVKQAIANVPAGFSQSKDADTPLLETIRQASRAAQRAENSLVRFRPTDDEVGIVIGDFKTRQGFAQRHLGPLRDYDQANGTELLRTLDVYYACDRSPGKTALALNVHRHTLMYRLKTIKSVLGVDPNSTKNVALLWMALDIGVDSSPHHA